MNSKFISITLVVLIITVVFFGHIALDKENTTSAEEPPSTVLIIEVYYDGYLSFDPEECMRIYNPTASAVDISGWQITDLEGIIEFPMGTSLPSNSSLYIAGNASAFYEESLIVPDFEYDVDSDPSVPQMIVVSGSMALANGGDEVILKDDALVIVDAVAYGGSGYAGTGWTGTPAKDVSEGSILKRRINETTGFLIDTNTSADWDYIRNFKIGQSDFHYSTFTLAGNVTTFVSPDSSFYTIASELDAASTSICLNLYEFTNPYLADHLIEAPNRGVDVKVFLEGGPVGGISDEERFIAKMLYENGSEVRFMINNDSMDIHDRYRFNHAKYCIIDNETIIVMSENWKPTGVPTDNTFGNRGWGIIIRNASVASYLAEVFFEDWNPERKDSFPFTPGDPTYGEPPPGFVMDFTIPEGGYISTFESSAIEGTFTVSPVIAPDTSLLTTKSVIGMIESATKSVFIEQLSCSKNWSWYGDYYDNWYLESAIDAARRGCQVKILLDSYYNWSDPDNYETVLHVNSIAETEGLDMEAKLAFLGGYEKIHNKGVIVDGNKTLVSSVNWGYNSVTNNREVGLIVENSEVAKYYSGVFWYDWDLTDFTIDLKHGWNLISIPLIQEEQNLTEVLGSIEGSYDAVQWHDITDAKDHWKHYKVGKPIGNDLNAINGSMGFWLHITRPGDTNFTYYGAPPIHNQTIQLFPGWNLVGYPSLTSYNRTKGLKNLTFGKEVDSIWTYNATTQKWNEIGEFDYFEVGRGYWVHAKKGCMWEVPL